jgi:diphthine synthase
LKTLVFVGLGLHDERGISLRGVEEARSADTVFVELYTSVMPGFCLERLEKLLAKPVRQLTRREVEEEGARVILEAAEKGKAVFLVPGDPFVATTHLSLRVEAEKRGVATRVVHGASVASSVISLSGLHNYKFGKTVTVPFAENFSETPYTVIAQNKHSGLHTLCLLDINVEEKRFLSVNEALSSLLKVEEKRREGAVTLETLAVAVARAGSDMPLLKAGYVAELQTQDYGDPPYSLVFPGKLHFTEAEALVTLAHAPLQVRSEAH